MTHETTFAGFPPYTGIGDLSADIAIIGIPHGTPYDPSRPSSCAQAPEAIRRAAARYATMLGNHDFDLGGPLPNNQDIRVVDCGNLRGDPSEPEQNRLRATKTVRSLIDAGAVSIVIGGDDSVPIPFFRAYHGDESITVIQVDAHVDRLDEVNGVTEGYSSTMRRASEMPWIERLIQVGMRGVGSARPEELAAARKYGAEIFTAKMVHEGG